MTAVVPAGLTMAGDAEATPGVATTASCSLARSAVWSAPGRQLDGEEERPVEPGAEALGQQVVGLAGLGAGRVVAGVDEAEPQRQHRQRQGQHDGQTRRW